MVFAEFVPEGAGAVGLRGGGMLTAQLFAERLRRAKKAAKAQAGYSCVVANPDGRMMDLPTSAANRIALGPGCVPASADSAQVRALASRR